MVSRLSFCLFLFFVLSFSSSAYAGGGWTNGRGAGFFKLESRLLSGNVLLNDKGEPVTLTPSVSVGIVSLYGAYGLLDTLDASLHVPYVYNSVSGISNGISEDAQSTFALGDVSLGLHYGVLRDRPFVLSLSADLGLPTGTNSSDGMDYTQTGTGVWRRGVGVEAGYATTDAWYLTGGLRYDDRSGGYSTTLGGEVRGGYFLLDRRVLLSAGFWSVFSLRDGDYQNPSQRFTVYANDTEYVAFGVAASYYFVPETMGLSVGFDGALMGRNILGVPSFHASVFYDL